MTTQALSIVKPEPLAQDTVSLPVDISWPDLQAAISGNLGRLTAEGQVKYYNALCKFTGLNPLGFPFEWITFQGKLKLYAKKDCAEQLRQIHGISIQVLDRKVEFGCIVTRVKAFTKDGREDEGIGAVPFNANNPELAANALMKSETKAKRRTTFSMVGLSLLDEEDVTPAGQAQAAVAAIGEESSAVRAERLNASLTEKEKASAVTVESSPAQPEPEHQPEASPAPPPVLPEPTTSAPVVTPPAGQAPPADSTGLLSEEEVAKLEASLSALPQPKRGIDYMVHRGWLEKGKPLNQTTQSAFKNITTKTPAFVRMVDGWKGQL